MENQVEYTISEASEITGYAPHVLRYYEKEFDIDVPRTDSNHRYYTTKEIELIQYIKLLQEKGFSNKQIKLIVSSPELVTPHTSENSLELVSNNTSLEIDASSIAVEISKSLDDIFFARLNEIIEKSNEDSRGIILELKEEIIELRKEINSKERDVLICENAKLKMEVKEKTYENEELNERLKKYEDGHFGFLKKIFRFTNIK